ncbi:glycosyltransferase family 2 protein [Smaragdicoccus niigatensis]|uniref:glycosyltransferase family 2 protein n=1 Tax=Smaragdicoccus niigatensis TaxID=359359 RepID=UPI000372AC6E|nr:hypothetical protein [Smaragdicoccus niigatensis]
MTVAIGLVVASIRPDEAAAQFESVLAQMPLPAYVSIAFQGSDQDFRQLRDAVRITADNAGFTDYSVVHDRGQGASRARNIALANVPETVTWVWTPNDTTRPTEQFLQNLSHSLTTATEDVGVVGLNYRVGDRFRRHVSTNKELTGWQVWHVIEPATVWRRDHLVRAGGFDERIGPGSDGWTQAGEGTDAIYRVTARGLTVSSAPLAVMGREQHLDPRSKFQRRKEFYYAVGVGCVIRRHYLTLRGLLAIVTPLVNWAIGRSTPGESRTLSLALAASSGRFLGIVLGDRACRIDRRTEHWH